MAHNLMIDNEGQEDEFVHFVYAEDKVGMPWHGLGRSKETPFTPILGLELLGGERLVRVVPLFFATGKISKGRSVLSPENTEFAVVGQDYEPFQEGQVAEVMQTALGDKPDRVITMGRLGRGERFFASMDLGQVEILDPTGTGFKELAKHFLVIETSHDKSRAFTMRLTTIVPVCQNTITLGERSAAVECRLLHTGSLEAQAQVVANALAKTNVMVERFEEAIGLLFTYTDVTADDVWEYAKLLFPHPMDDVEGAKIPTIIQNKRDLLFQAYEEAPGCKDTPETGFRLYQAATRLNGKVLRSKGGWAQDQFQPASVDFRERAYSMVLTLLGRVSS